MAGVQELPLQVPRPILHGEGPFLFLALIGASVMVFSVAGKSPLHAGFGLAGFLLWLLGMARLLLFGQIGQHPLFPAALAAATAKLNVEKLKHLLLAGQAPPPEPEPAASPTPA